MKVHNYKIMLKVSLALYPAVNSNFSIVFGTLSTESGKSHLCLVVNNKNLNFFWHVYVALLDTVTLYSASALADSGVFFHLEFIN